jgi:hypothetical protein
MTANSRWNWVILWVIALATRLPAAFLLPNAEQDGYSYAEIIARWSTSFSAGHFRLADLFGFWLPLFPLAAAIPNTWIGDSLLAGKIVSGLCGTATCLLVFAVTEKLTRNALLACLAFAVMLFSPLHILYSAACMTDIPFACLVLASLWFALQRRWIGAAIFAATAEGVRIEAWALILLLPLLQLAQERRVLPLLIGILFLPSLSWVVIGYLATGDPFAFFAERARYNASYLDFHPTRRGFASNDISRDVVYFLLGANRTVFLAGIAASGVLIFKAIRQPRSLCWPVAVTAAYFLALLGFVVLAYVTKSQPVLLPRYALSLFALGLPLFAWVLHLLIRNQKAPWFGKLIAVTAIVFCFWQLKRQLPIISKVRDDFRAHRQIAEAVATAFQQSSDDKSRCFSDDVAVRVLSRLPPAHFVRSATAPGSAHQNVINFESFLREQRVAYLVFMPTEDSLPVKFYPNLGRRGGIGPGNFQLITAASSSFGPDIWLYRLHSIEEAR